MSKEKDKLIKKLKIFELFGIMASLFSGVSITLSFIYNHNNPVISFVIFFVILMDSINEVDKTKLELKRLK